MNVKTAGILLFNLCLFSCATTSGGGYKIESYSVEPIGKDSILVFEKKAEYDNEDYEKQKNEIIVYCSKHLANKGYHIFNKVVRESDSVKFYTRGATIIKTFHETKSTDTGQETTVYITFERYRDKTGIIGPVHGIKAKKLGGDPFSLELADGLCKQVAESLD